MSTPHEILEIAVGASPQEIKAAFYRLARIHHPDVGGDGVQFSRLSSAYAFLSGEGGFRLGWVDPAPPMVDTPAWIPKACADAWASFYQSLDKEKVRRAQTADGVEALRRAMESMPSPPKRPARPRAQSHPTHQPPKAEPGKDPPWQISRKGNHYFRCDWGLVTVYRQGSQWFWILVRLNGTKENHGPFSSQQAAMNDASGGWWA